MTPVDWLLMPQQTLLEATRGQVHADLDGGLGQVRVLLAWFPPQVHRRLLACRWERIGQEEAFVGRAAPVGDNLGSRLITARLTRELMRLQMRRSPFTPSTPAGADAHGVPRVPGDPPGRPRRCRMSRGNPLMRGHDQFLDRLTMDPMALTCGNRAALGSRTPDLRITRLSLRSPGRSTSTDSAPHGPEATPQPGRTLSVMPELMLGGEASRSTSAR
jgi:hypothetical protein